MDDWIPLSVLPNVDVQCKIEGGLIALVSSEHPRVLHLCEEHPTFGEFLSRFTDAFNVPLKPSVIIASSNAPKSVITVEAMTGFRDAFSASVVPYTRSGILVYEQQHRIGFSNTFSIYPWMIDKNYKYLVADPPGMVALHVVEEFKGQSDANTLQMGLNEVDIDKPLLEALLKVWENRFTSQNPTLQEIALFRSLNMANAAMQTPGGRDAVFYDFGRAIALLISACEILAHPGEGKSGLKQVYELLEKVEWIRKKSAHRRYLAHSQSKIREKRNLACWLYGELHKVRNDFLHGNPVNLSRLRVKGSKRSLFDFIAPIYRMMLTGFLPLNWTRKLPSVDDAEKFAKYVADEGKYMRYQDRIEQALHLSRIQE